jgi:hypothetical protein
MLLTVAKGGDARLVERKPPEPRERLGDRDERPGGGRQRAQVVGAAGVADREAPDARPAQALQMRDRPERARVDARTRTAVPFSSTAEKSSAVGSTSRSSSVWIVMSRSARSTRCRGARA